MPKSIYSSFLHAGRCKICFFGIIFFLIGFFVHAQQRIGGSLEGGLIHSILSNGEVSESETNPAFGASFVWSPGELIVKPGFLTDGDNLALSTAVGARFFQRLGLSIQATLLRDAFQNTFFDDQQQLQTLDRNQWFVLFGGELSFFPNLRLDQDRNSWVLSVGFNYLNGGTYVGKVGVGYIWQVKDRK